jgi:Zn-dependent protease
MFGRSGGIPIGTYLGIPVRLHSSWFIILAIMTMGWTNLLRSESGIPYSVAFPVALGGVLAAFLSLLFHEYGHALAARFYGIQTERITLFLFGGMAEIRSEPKTPGQEFVIAGAGPLVSLLLAAFFAGLNLLLLQLPTPPYLSTVVSMLLIINLIFAIFNLLPGFPMDGGRMLRAFMWWITGDVLNATKWASRGGQLIGVLLAGVGLVELIYGHFGGIFLILTGLFIRWLAGNAYRQTQMRSAIDTVRVADLMRPIEIVIPHDATLRWAVRSAFNRHGGERYAVVRDNALLGYVSARDVATIPREQWDQVEVGRLVRHWSTQELLTPELPAMTAYQQLGELSRHSLPVFQGRELVGFLFMGDVSNHIGRFMDRTRL